MASTVEQIKNEPDPFGAKVLEDGRTRFRIWMPSQDKVRPEGVGNPRIYLADTDEHLEMEQCGDGWYELVTDKAPHDARYKVEFWNHHGDQPGWFQVPDPASRRQATTVHGYSVVFDPKTLTRGNEPADWGKNRDDNRVIYEMHLGTFSEEGTARGAIAKLDYLKALGVTDIEVMPVHAFGYKHGWGYDGVLFGAFHNEYGTPQDLADLSTAAHERGMGVILDVVYNHIGPYGNYIWMHTPQFLRFDDLENIERKSMGFMRLPVGGDQESMAAYAASNERKLPLDKDGKEVATPWGPAINLEAWQVRIFFEQIDAQWKDDFHLDGVRRDAVHALIDPRHAENPKETHFVAQLHQNSQASAAAQGRDFFDVLESEHNIPSKLDPDHKGDPQTRGTAAWADDFHHAIWALLKPAKGLLERGYYQPYTKDPRTVLIDVMKRGFALDLDTPRNHAQTPADLTVTPDPRRSVIFMQNHDQIGNRPQGDPAPATLKDDPFRDAKLKLMASLTILSPFTPMLWQGEERELETPFPFFADVEDPGERQNLINGRKDELKQYADLEFIDPTALTTVERSKIPWPENAQDDPAFKFRQALIAERAKKIGPHLASGLADVKVEPIGAHGLAVTYTFGDGFSYARAMNFGDQPMALPRDWDKAANGGLTSLAKSVFKGQTVAPWSVATTYAPVASSLGYRIGHSAGKLARNAMDNFGL